MPPGKRRAVDFVESLDRSSSVRMRGCPQLALAIAGPADLSHAPVARLRSRIHKARSQKTYDTSRLHLALAVLKRRGVTPSPLQRDTMELVYGILSAAHYRSAAAYVSALRASNALQGHSVDPAAAEYCKFLRRASVRDLGSPKHSEALSDAHLLRLVEAANWG